MVRKNKQEYQDSSSNRAYKNCGFCSNFSTEKFENIWFAEEKEKEENIWKLKIFGGQKKQRRIRGEKVFGGEKYLLWRRRTRKREKMFGEGKYLENKNV